MSLPWSRILGALAAGGGVPLVLFLLTVASEDRPLWGMDPDLQLWIAGALAALAGAVAYAGVERRSAKKITLGAGLGVAGFLVLVVATMVIVASFPGPHASYEGWTAETRYNETWNASVAQVALEAQGFNVTRADGEGLVAHDRDGTRVFIDQPRPGDDQAGQAFRMTVQFERDGDNVGSVSAAREQAEADRPRVEEAYATFIEGFEERTGWTHDTQPRWQPGIAVS